MGGNAVVPSVFTVVNKHLLYLKINFILSHITPLGVVCPSVERAMRERTPLGVVCPSVERAMRERTPLGVVCPSVERAMRERTPLGVVCPSVERAMPVAYSAAATGQPGLLVSFQISSQINLTPSAKGMMPGASLVGTLGLAHRGRGGVIFLTPVHRAPGS